MYKIQGLSFHFPWTHRTKSFQSQKKKKAVSKIAAGSNGENLPELYLCFFQDIILFTSLDLIHSLCLRQFKQNFCLVQIKVSMHKIASIVFIGAPYYMLTALLIAVQDVW